eukprot:5204484-Pleurochrysis_carterae.AAC.5
MVNRPQERREGAVPGSSEQDMRDFEQILNHLHADAPRLPRALARTRHAHGSLPRRRNEGFQVEPETARAGDEAHEVQKLRWARQLHRWQSSLQPQNAALILAALSPWHGTSRLRQHNECRERPATVHGTRLSSWHVAVRFGSEACLLGHRRDADFKRGPAGQVQPLLKRVWQARDVLRPRHLRAAGHADERRQRKDDSRALQAAFTAAATAADSARVCGFLLACACARTGANMRVWACAFM